MELFSHSWLPFFYLYGVGGLFFLSGILIIKKSGSLKFNDNAVHGRWLKVLYFGFIWYVLIHFFLTYFALK